MCLRNGSDFGHDKHTVGMFICTTDFSTDTFNSSTEPSVDMDWKTETIHDMMSNLFTRTRLHGLGRS